MYKVLSEQESTAMVYKAHRCLSELSIPEKVDFLGKKDVVKEIEYDAFSYLNCLFVLDLASVETIKDGYVETYEDGAKNYHGAFSHCGALREVDFGEVQYLGDYGFYACKALTSVNLKNVVEIGRACFGACEGLQSAILGEKVERVGSGAFSAVECLSEVIVKAAEPPLCEDNVYSDKVLETAVLKVPQGKKSAYGMSKGRDRFSRKEEIPSTGIDRLEQVKVQFVNGGGIRVSGVAPGEKISVFDIAGRLIGSEVSKGDIIQVNTYPARVLLLKIGTQNFKMHR